MTTPATETVGGAQASYGRAQADEARTRSTGGGFLQRRYGPLPGWAWSLIVAGGAVAYFLYRRRTAAGSTGSGTATSYTGTGTSGAAYGAELAAIQREIAAMQGSSATTSSTKTKTVKVPDLVGKDVENATKALETAGLTYNPDLLAPGRKGYLRKVHSQNPKAGASVPKGTFVHVYWKFEKEDVDKKDNDKKPDNDKSKAK